MGLCAEAPAGGAAEAADGATDPTAVEQDSDSQIVPVNCPVQEDFQGKG